MYANSGKQTVYAIDAATGKSLVMQDFRKTSQVLQVEVLLTGKMAMIKEYCTLPAIANGNRCKTGKIIPSFGTNGKINLDEGVRDDPQNFVPFNLEESIKI